MRMLTTAPLQAAFLLAPLLLNGCGDDTKKPSEADIAAYLAQSEPGWLHVSGVKGEFEKADSAGTSKVAEGSWRVRVTFNLHTTQDLYTPESDARSLRLNFDKKVNEFTLYREARIAAVNDLALRAGLMRQGDATPEPAVPVVLTTHADQDIPDEVTLLAQPQGSVWSFVQTDAQKVSDSDIGAPLDEIRRSSPRTVFVIAGSDEDRAYRVRAGQFLAAIAKAAAGK
jgi:hypothetical protein